MSCLDPCTYHPGTTDRKQDAYDMTGCDGSTTDIGCLSGGGKEVVGDASHFHSVEKQPTHLNCFDRSN